MSETRVKNPIQFDSKLKFRPQTSLSLAEIRQKFVPNTIFKQKSYISTLKDV